MNIDRIARGMVEVEPSADLEARIRRRLDAAPAPVSSSWWSWKVALPALSAAAIVTTIVVRDPGSGVQGPGSGVPGPAVIASRPTVVPGPEVSTTTVKVPPVRRTAVVQTAAPQLSAEELAWMERRVAALAPVTALDVDRLHVASIQPEPLAITPLVMTPIDTDGAGRERRDEQ